MKAAGVHKKAIAFATSLAVPNLAAGTPDFIASAISSSVFPCDSAFFVIRLFNLLVFVNPGNTLFTVIPYAPNSIDRVFAQLATAALIVLETPKSWNRSFYRSRNDIYNSSITF